MNLVGRKFNNPRLNIDINVYEIDGENWFMGKEATSLLGYSENSRPLRKWGERGSIVWEENKKKIYVRNIEIIGKCAESTSEQKVNNNVVMVNEAGLYQLIFGSSLPEATEFQRWVFYEILPSLKNNGYVIDEKNISKEQFERLEKDYLRVKGYLFDLCGMGKISLGRASELIFGNDKELRKRLMNLGWIDYENCKFTQQKFKNSKGDVYELFVCNVSGTYNNGVVKHSLQVSITNAGYIWLKDKFEKDNNLGLKREE